MLSSLGTDRSITVSGCLFLHPRNITVNTLIDSGCTGIGCIDHKLVDASGLRRQRLPRPQPLYLANGELSSFLEHFVVVQLGIGPHDEEIALVVTNLGQQNPIILGFPWLAHHNPRIDWPTRTIQFGSRNCRDHCLPTGIAIEDCVVPSITTPETPAPPPAQELVKKITPDSRNGYRPPSVEDAEDEDEGYFSDPDAPELPIPLGPRSPRTYGTENRAIECPAWNPVYPRRTGAGSALRPQHYEPATIVAGARRTGRSAITGEAATAGNHRTSKVTPPPRHPPDPLKEDDIRLLSASNFLTLSRQHDVQIFRTTWGNLEEATKTHDPIRMPSLPEPVFQDILRSRGDLTTYKEMFPVQC